MSTRPDPMRDMVASSLPVRREGDVPAPLAIIERALISAHDVTSEEAERATEWLAELRRSDWASRVLDQAVVHLGYSRDAYPEAGIEGQALVDGAKVVWPQLPDAVRAGLGECP